MMQSFDGGNLGNELADTGLKSLAAMSKSMQAITAEATEFSRRSVEQSSAAFEQIVQARSPDEAVEAQADYARLAYEGFISQATRMGELYADMAKEVYKPFERLGTRSR